MNCLYSLLFRLVNLNFQRKDQKPQQISSKFEKMDKQEEDDDAVDHDLQRENEVLMKKYISNVEQVKSIQSVLVEISGVVQKFNEILVGQNLTTEKGITFIITLKRNVS